jgi:hypothetical protein
MAGFLDSYTERMQWERATVSASYAAQRATPETTETPYDWAIADNDIVVIPSLRARREARKEGKSLSLIEAVIGGMTIEEAQLELNSSRSCN